MSLLSDYYAGFNSTPYETDKGVGQYVNSGFAPGWMDWSKIPGLEFLSNYSTTNDVSGQGVDYQSAIDQLGYRPWEMPLENGTANLRGILDQSGNWVGTPQEIRTSGDKDWFLASLAMMGGAAAAQAAGIGAASGAGAADATAGAGFVGEGAASGIPAWDAAMAGGTSTLPATIGGSLAPMESIAPVGQMAPIADTLPILPETLMPNLPAMPPVPGSLPQGTPNSTPNAPSSLVDWFKSNPDLAKVLLPLLGAGATQIGGDSGYKYSGPMPSMSTQGWSPTANATLMAPNPQPLLNRGQGEEQSGLWRFLK